MTDKEKITLKDTVIKIFNSFNVLEHRATIGGLRDDVLRAINSVEEEPVSEDLEKAAYKYSDDIYEKNRNKYNPDWNSYADGYEQAISCHVSDAFIEGANWQKEQFSRTSKGSANHRTPRPHTREL